MERFHLVWVCAFFLFCGSLSAHGVLSKETLQQLFPEAENFVSRQKALTPQQISAVEKETGRKLGPEDRSLTVYVAVATSPESGRMQSLGGILMVDAAGPGGLIDIAMACNLDGSVKRVLITGNGGEKELEDQAFLKQFESRGPSDSWEPGDFQAAGTPESTEAVVQAVRRGVHLFMAFMDR